LYNSVCCGRWFRYADTCQHGWHNQRNCYSKFLAKLGKYIFCVDDVVLALKRCGLTKREWFVLKKNFKDRVNIPDKRVNYIEACIYEDAIKKIEEYCKRNGFINDENVNG